MKNILARFDLASLLLPRLAVALCVGGCLFVARPASAQFDIYGTTTPVVLATNQPVSATITNVGIDLHAYIGTPLVLLSFTNGVGTNATLDVRLQTSASLSSGYTDISGGAFAQATNTVTTNAGLAGILTLGVSPGAVSQYVRSVQTISAGSTWQTAITVVGRLKYN